MNSLATIAIGVLRRFYIRVHNMRLADKVFLASIKLVFGSAYTALLGQLNAGDIERRAGKSVPVAFTPVDRPADLATFILHMAARCDERLPPSAAIDLVVNATPATHIDRYASIARLFHSRVNLHVTWNVEDAKRLIPTLADATSIERLHADLAPQGGEPAVLSEKMIGRIHARQFHANQAREFLKARGWAACYCALSLPDEWRVENIRAALSRFNAEHQDWRLVLLGDSAHIQLQPHEAHERLILPCYAGVEFSTQIALAMECDAYFGQCDHFGISAVLSRRSATVFDTGDSFEISDSLRNNSLRVLVDANSSMIQTELAGLVTHATNGA